MHGGFSVPSLDQPNRLTQRSPTLPIPPSVSALSDKVMQLESKISSCRTSEGRKAVRVELDAARIEYRRAFRQAKNEGLAN